MRGDLISKGNGMGARLHGRKGELVEVWIGLHCVNYLCGHLLEDCVYSGRSKFIDVE